MKQLIVRLQDRAASILGLDPQRRTPLVRAMLHPARGDAAGYWLQIVISATLATLGLALDSTAVVIGAMLIAPLMRPIVELAMGLATGSTPLVFRTGFRAIASIVVVVTASAAFSALLPFREITSELLARTAPSMLDLFVAAACAVAGAYAVVLAGSDVATTAAGTSIGISLVPPLCTAGYGISIGDWNMAIGAGLLFTANVTGIVTVASALFVIVGFGQVDIWEEEKSLDEDADVGAATRIGRNVSRRDARRLNVVPRVLLPLLLLGAIAYPLLRALDAMSHRSSVRQQVARLMKQSHGERIVQYSLDQKSRPITLRVVVVGDSHSARAMEQRLHDELARLGEPEAAVAVWAVSDATAVSALSARLDDVPAMLPPPPSPSPPPPPPLTKRVRAAWPTKTAGELLSVWTADATPSRVRVSHLGPEIGAAGREMLARAAALGDDVPSVEEVALIAVEAGADDVYAWLPRALEIMRSAREFPSVHYCLTLPAPKRGRADATADLARKVIVEQASFHANAVVRTEGERWRVVPQLEPCAAAVPPAAP